MAVFKNNRGTWTAKFYYTDWTGEKKQKKKEGFKTKREGQEFEKDFINKYENSPNITFENLIKNYIEDSKTRLKPSTMQTKINVINKHILPYFKNLKLTDIDTLKTRNWQNTIIKYNLSETYKRTINNYLSAVMTYAVKYYGMNYNPIKKCGSIGSSKTEKMKFWTIQEFNKFIKEFKNNKQLTVIYKTLFYSGMRIGELLALQTNDFNYEEKTVSITKSYIKIKGEEIIQKPKTKKSNRKINIPKELIKEIEEYTKLIYKIENNQRIFNISKPYINEQMDKGIKKAGIKRIRLHDLRHSHASLLIEMGVQPLIISERLGHEDIKITLSTYAHLYPNKQEEIAKKLETIYT